jgi:phospholipid transport system substrate-binding protein
MNASRRTLIRAAGLAVAALPRAARAQDPGAQAATFVQQAGKELGTLVGGAPSPADKRRLLQPFIDRVVDVDAVARFCLGRFWAAATPAQRGAFTRLFHAVLLNNVVARMGDYRQGEVKVTVGQADVREDGVHVPTVVDRSGEPPARVVWLVQFGAGGPRIVDVIAEGTSLRLTVRSDYNAFLAQHGNEVDALIGALQQQLAQSGS